MTCSGNYTVHRKRILDSDPRFTAQLIRHAMALLSMAENLATPLQFFAATSKACNLLNTFTAERYCNLPYMAEQISLLCSLHVQLAELQRSRQPAHIL